MSLSKAQIARYSRQLILPELGVRGQERLRRASVLIIGAGGLGSPAAFYLAAAGVGTLGILDHDAVALSNLHRQILHTTEEVGRPKSHSAKRRLEALNPDVQVEAIQASLTAANALKAVSPFDVVVDGTDNFTARYLTNDTCVLAGKPLVYGGVVQFRGQVMTIRPRTSACFRCVFPEPPLPDAVPSCQEAGILGSIAGVIGSLMAQEVLKLLAGMGQLLTDRLLVFDGLNGRFREVAVRRNPACAVCGDAPSVRAPESTGQSSACGRAQQSTAKGRQSD